MFKVIGSDAESFNGVAPLGIELAEFVTQSEAESFAEQNKAKHPFVIVSFDGRALFEVSSLDQPTDTEVADAVTLLGLKPHEVPEGYASWNGTGFVRLPVLPCFRGGAVPVAEIDAWVQLLLKARHDAEAAVDEQVRDAEAA